MGLEHEEYKDTEAYKRGEAEAVKEVASVDPTIASVSRATAAYEDREYFKLCLICGWARDSDRCICRSERLRNDRR